MYQKINELTKRTNRYLYEDGFVEIAIGFFFFTIGVLLRAWLAIKSGSVWSSLFVLGLPLLTIGAAFFLIRLIQRTKERVTFPRTGYVAYRQGKTTRKRWSKLMWMGLIGLFLLMFFIPERYARMSLPEGLFLGLILGDIGHSLGIQRFYFLATLSMILGVGAAVLVNDDILGTIITLTGMGLAMILSGGFTFVAYIRQYPKAAEDEEA